MPKLFAKKYIYLWIFSILAILLLLVGIFMFSQSRAKPKKKELEPLKSVIIQPTTNHSASVIFLHGLGDNATNWQKKLEPIARTYPHVKFIMPQAPEIPVSMNWGWKMPAWYNIKGNTRDIMNLKEDKAGLLKSVDQIKKIVQSEINSGLPPQRIIVAGHSQGAAVALAVGLTADCHLAGIIGLSGFLPCRTEIFNWAKSENKKTPFFLYHTYYDDVIPADIGSQSAQLLKEKGYQVEFEGDFNGNHFFDPEEL